MEDKRVVLLEKLKQVHQTVLQVFRQKPDKGEEWKMPSENFDGRQEIVDDCDGFCLAVRFLLRDGNIPNRLVYCEVEDVGHLVVEVQGWILDNRQNTVVSNTLLKAFRYKFMRISGYEKGDPWREILSV